MKPTPIRPVTTSGTSYADGDQQDDGQRADRPVRAVLEVDVLGQGALADQVDRQRPDVHRADAEAERDR